LKFIVSHLFYIIPLLELNRTSNKDFIARVRPTIIIFKLCIFFSVILNAVKCLSKSVQQRMWSNYPSICENIEPDPLIWVLEKIENKKINYPCYLKLKNFYSLSRNCQKWKRCKKLYLPYFSLGQVGSSSIFDNV